MSKKVIIIGAGLAGLSAGIHLQQRGIQTEIFELAAWAGGVCTAWTRKGYRFDGCIHWMVGTKPGDGFNELYREVDALTADTPIYNAPSIQMEIGGEMLTVPMQFPEFKAFLHAVSPQDAAAIDAFCADVEIMVNSRMPTGTPTNLAGLIKFMKESRGFLPLARKYMGITMEEMVKPFQSQKLRSILLALMPPNFSAEAIIMMLGTRMSGNAGYPLGGAQGVIERMEAKYRALGGQINFLSKVDEIVVEDGKATGIRSNSTLHPADAVVAACDAYDTLKRMLGGKFQHEQLDGMLASAPLFDPLALVSFGLKRQLGIPFSIQYECPEGIRTSPDSVQHGLHLRSFDFDPSAAPQGGSSVMVMLGAPLDYWQNLRTQDPHSYKQQKQQLADAVADALERRIPGFKEAIDVTDVATPASYVHLVNLYKGSFEGFEPTPTALKSNIRKTLPGVKHLVLCGQWTVAGGGICTAVQSGKEAAQLVAKELK
jgi:phytoene dehydrogenase-like protein